MGSPKNYTVGGMLTADDEPEIQALLARHPLWKLKHARDAVARRKFQQRINDAGKRKEAL